MDIVRERQPGEPTIIPNGDAVIVYRGRIGALVTYPVLVDVGDGYVKKNFEKFVRPPGTRIIAERDGKILLQKERRLEIDGFDWRLPGGKVFDTFEEFAPYMSSTIPEQIILDAAAKELHEEAHLKVNAVTLFDTRACGATVTWDLHYVVATGISEEAAPDHSEGEEVAAHAWRTYEEVEQMCRSGEIQEGRSVAVLLQYISKQ